MRQIDRRPLLALLLAPILLLGGCNRETFLAGKRLDVQLDWDYLYRNRGPHDTYSTQRMPGLWIPIPANIPTGDPRVTLVVVGACIGVGLLIVVGSEVVSLAKTGKTDFGHDLYTRMSLRMACNGRMFEAPIQPGRSRIVLTDELEQALKTSDVIVSIHSEGDLRVDRSVRLGALRNPERAVLRFLGDGHTYVDDVCVE